MIMAEAVIKSEKGRHHELLSDLGLIFFFSPIFLPVCIVICMRFSMLPTGDRPLVVQFAARHGEELAEAAAIAYWYVMGSEDLQHGPR